MALNHSPQIVTNGLVFAYDMANTKKSWKGMPTVNILTSGTGYDAALERSGTGYPFTSVNITSYVLANWTASNNKLSMSFEGRRDYSSGGTGGGGDGYPVMYIYFSDWTWSSSFGISTYDWSYNKIENITMPDPTGKTVYFSVYHMSSGNPGKSYSRNHQIEFNSFATPFVNGTRSNTQVVLDLMNNNTVTADSLTYNSDGTFSFNGSTSYMDLGSTTQLTNNFTLSVWHKNPNTGYVLDQGNIGSDPSSCIEWTNCGLTLGSNNIASVSDNTSLSSINRNVWNNVVCTFSNGSVNFYLNGNLTYTTAASFTSFSPNNHILKIGRRAYTADANFSGIIGVLNTYNRALTATEVLQNFNALRSRFGI